MIKVCIADNLPVIRYGIESFFKESINIKIVAQAGNFKKLETVLRDKPIDVMITDLNLNGLENLNQLKKVIILHKSTKFIVFSTLNKKIYEANILKAGVKMFVSKFDKLEVLQKNIMVVAENSQSSIFMKGKIKTVTKKGNINRFQKLSLRESEVLRFILEGKKNIEA